MQVRLRIRTELPYEVLHDVEHTALCAPDRMRQIEIIEVGAIVEGYCHTAISIQVAGMQPRHNVAKIDDSNAHLMQQPQIMKKRNMIIQRIIVAANAGCVIRQNRDLHE